MADGPRPPRAGLGGFALHILGLSALWGSSYMFIKLGVEEMPPTVLVAERIVVAAAVLTPVLVARLGLRATIDALRTTGRGVWVLAISNATLPWLLLAWGETHIDSGVAAIGNATIPLCVALLAIRFRPSERPTRTGLAGLGVGLVGVGVLVGVEPGGGWWAIAGTLAVLVSSLCFGSSTLYAQSRYTQSQPLVVATAVTLAATAVSIPLALAATPSSVPSGRAFAAGAALGIFGTAIAWVLLYRTLARYGAARTSLSAYLLPVFALAYGAAILDESLSWASLLGLALILSGVALASGLRTRARPVAASTTG